MYETMTPELIDIIDNVTTIAKQLPSQRQKFAEAALGFERVAGDIAAQAVKVGDPLLRQSATTVADGLNAAAQLCRAAIESES